MHSVNLIHIENTTDSNVILWPKDEELRDDFAVFIQAKCFVILDYKPEGRCLDLDEFYLEFELDKVKISIDDAHKFGIEILGKTI